MHGIDQHNFGRKRLQKVAGIAVEQRHARNDGGEVFAVVAGGVHGAIEGGVDLGVALNEGDLGTKRSEEKRVAPHAGGRVHDGWQRPFCHAAGPRQGVPPALATAQTETDGAADKVDHYWR